MFRPTAQDQYGTERFILPVLLGCALVAPGCAKMPRRTLQANSQNATELRQPEAPNGTRININIASPAELERLPGVGKVTAAHIIAYRERYGRFRRAEHLMMIRGISERRFRELRALITVE